jgi:hypothetical protein
MAIPTGKQILESFPRMAAGEVRLGVNNWYCAVKELVRQREYWANRMPSHPNLAAIEAEICSDQIRNLDIAIEMLRGAKQ